MDEYEMKIDENGDVYTKVLYPEKPIEINVGGVNHIVGIQPVYGVVNIVYKDKKETLLKYLNEQKALLTDRKQKAEDVIKQTDGFNLEGMKEAIQILPLDKIRSKKLQELNEVAKCVLMANDAQKNLVVIEQNISKIQKQIDFLTKI